MNIKGHEYPLLVNLEKNTFSEYPDFILTKKGYDVKNTEFIKVYEFGDIKVLQNK